jgi:hypothetical protein
VRDSAAYDANDDGAVDAESPPNIVFVTSAVTVGGTLGAIGNADVMCATAASGAGLAGTYRAWISTSTVNAIDRLTGARGWVRPDGRPVADRAQDLVDGRIWYPIRIDEAGNTVTGNTLVVTGTQSSGLVESASTCGDYTSTTGSLAVGSVAATTAGFTRTGITVCSAMTHVYCFGIERDVPVTVTPTTGRRAFVSASAFTPGGGRSAADGVCATDASAAGLSGTFQALLATTSQAAATRFSTAGPTWVRLDGIPIVSTAADLATGTLIAPLNVGADGTTYTTDPVYTGATNEATTGTADSSCSSWTSASTSLAPETGLASTIEPRHFSGLLNTNCSFSYKLYCLEP